MQSNVRAKARRHIIQRTRGGYLVMLDDGCVCPARNQREAISIVKADDERIANGDEYNAVVSEIEWRGVRRLLPTTQ